jgi:hypothetical protein
MHSVDRSFAAVLVFFLSAMTSWASACDLSCSLGQFHSVCELHGTAPSGEHVESSPSSGMAMNPNMDMPRESSMAALPQSETGLIHLHANSCTHNPCNETSASATSKSATEHPLPALQLTAFELPSIAAMSWRTARFMPERASPRLQPFDPLSASLRI